MDNAQNKSPPQHTPGPWMFDKVETSCGHCFRIGSAEQLRKGREDRLSIAAYACLYVDYGNANIQAQANAHLLAAAPELLEAVKDLMETWESNPDHYEKEIERYAPLIAKAEGRA